jgi:hypothetical protein
MIYKLCTLKKLKNIIYIEQLDFVVSHTTHLTLAYRT